MSRGVRLTEKEKGKIELLRSQNWSTRAIAQKLKRSQTVISHYCRKKSSYGLKGKSGRKKMIPTITRKKIISLASREKMSAIQIQAELSLDSSVRTVQRVLSSSPHLIKRKFKQKPPLTTAHRSARLEFARRSIQNRVDWSKIVWSDEKKFNLDGPDGIHSYWHDLRNDQKYLSRRVHGGGSLMIWGAFVANEIFDLQFIETKNNSQRYTDMLETALMPFMDNDLTFMQDNAPIHVSKHSKEWFENNGIKLLQWPARSPDLNPIENLWGILTRVVFANGRQYKNKDELKAAVLEAWDSINADTLAKLSQSMPNRLFSVISKKGASIDY
jgi:transposase